MQKRGIKMKKLIYLVNSLFASLITTMILLTISFLLMLFGSKSPGYRTSYFGSIYFKNQETSSQTLGMELGVSNFYPIIITLILLTIVYFFILLFFKKKDDTKQ